jgi:acyl-coenzyme A thioesterase PaaI-like protein
VVGEARLMKLGKALAVIEVEIRAEGSDKMSSHAIVTYALPREA